MLHEKGLVNTTNLNATTSCTSIQEGGQNKLKRKGLDSENSDLDLNLSLKIRPKDDHYEGDQKGCLVGNEEVDFKSTSLSLSLSPSSSSKKVIRRLIKEGGGEEMDRKLGRTASTLDLTL